MATKAFIVGIAEYANPKNNLFGVERDVSAIVSVMSKFGITDLEIIRDSNATAENIRNGLHNLFSDAREGDVRIFYYSGHGALLPPGFGGSNDPDGRDEALVPYEGTVSTLIMDNWERWCRFLRQEHKVDRPMERTIQHEDTQTVYGRVQGQGCA